MMRGVANGVMKQIAAERFDASARVHLKRLVNQAIAPTAPVAIEQPQLIVGIPAAAPHPAVHIERATRDAIAIGAGRLVVVLELLNRAAKFRRDSLVGVEAERPVIAGGV